MNNFDGNKYIEAMEEYVEKKRIENTEYSVLNEEDHFKVNGENRFSVLDVWKYAYSQLSDDIIAEFLIAKALGLEKSENNSYWTAYDMSYRKKRIEVKATVYVHPWNKEKVSQVRTFSIAPSKNSYWLDVPTPNVNQDLERQSEVYVFCLNANQDIKQHDILNIDHWEFYVVPTYVINSYAEQSGNPNQKKISLGVVKSLANGSVSFDGIKDAVDKAIDMSDEYYRNLSM